tara:strand:+ start:151 stop:330 length:180 start_codon:yes stop_codon:yes gene_type:complete
MKAFATRVFIWAKDALIEWLEGPEGRKVVIQVLRDLVKRTDTKLDDAAVEVVIKGLENV